MKGFKAFQKGLKCRDFQFEVGKEHTHEGDIELCGKGFHFCENPLDVLQYYPLIGSEFAEIEATGKVATKKGENKHCTDRITVKAKLGLYGLAKASVDFIWERAKKRGICKKSKTTTADYAHAATAGNDAHAATAGERANAATAGERANAATAGNDAHAATAGERANAATAGNDAHAATAGNDAHAATAGNYAHAATAGERANAATAGERANAATAGNDAHAATAGNDAHAATAGNYAHAATAGERANAATAGYAAHAATAGKDAVACAIGREATAKGTKGCWLVIAEWDETPGNIKPLAIISVQVDGKKVKENTFYRVKKGKLVEVV